MAMTHKEAIDLLKQEYKLDNGETTTVFKVASANKFNTGEDEAFKAKALEAFQMRADRHMCI